MFNEDSSWDWKNLQPSSTKVLADGDIRQEYKNGGSNPSLPNNPGTFTPTSSPHSSTPTNNQYVLNTTSPSSSFKTPPRKWRHLQWIYENTKQCQFALFVSDPLTYEKANTKE